MDLVRKILFAFMGVLLIVPSCTSAGQICGYPSGSALEVLVGTRNAGSVTRDAYRLTEDGVLTRARWTDQNQLIGLSGQVRLGADAYAEAQRVLAVVTSTPKAPQDSAVSPVPQVLSLELTRYDASRGAELVLRDNLTVGLDTLLKDWQRAAPLSAAGRGTYVWALWAPGAGGQTMSLSASACSGAMESTVGQALTGPDIVAPLPASAQSFADNVRGRTRFIGGAPGGAVKFGVISSE